MTDTAHTPTTAKLGRVLLVGGTGMLGRAWRELLETNTANFTAVGSKDVDVTDPTSVAQAITPDTNVVINCSAWTDVDAAETHFDEACAVNGTGVANLADRCGRVGATLIHYSTDYVFDGQADQPYEVNATTDPVNAYGRSKLLGEQALQQSGCRYLLLRTSWLYAPWSKNFVRTMARLMGDKPSLKVVNDQRGRPTSSQHLASVSLALLRQGATGVFHATDGGETTWFDFANEIARHLSSKCNIEPCASEAFPTPAQRPHYSVMSLRRIEDELGTMSDWKDNLASVMQQLESD